MFGFQELKADVDAIGLASDQRHRDEAVEEAKHQANARTSCDQIEIGQDGAGGDCPGEAALVIIRSDHCGTKGRGDDTDRVGACD